jgi:hypothetical protein
MTAAIRPLRSESAELPEVIAGLLSERTAIIAEMERLASAVNKPRVAAEAALAEVDAELTALNDADNAAWGEWARDQEGEAPTPRTAERRTLATRRTEALADIDGANIAAVAIAPRLNELNAEIRRLNHCVFAEKLRVALEKARRLDAEAHEIALEMREPIAQVVALKMMLAGETMSAAQNSGDKAAVRLVGEAIETLNGFAMPEVGGDSASLPRFMAEWGEALR